MEEVEGLSPSISTKNYLHSIPDPHEALPQTNNEMEQLVRIDRMLGDYFPEDIAFVLKQLADENDILSFLYGQLFDIGEDPNEVLARYGIIEG